MEGKFCCSLVSQKLYFYILHICKWENLQNPQCIKYLFSPFYIYVYLVGLTTKVCVWIVFDAEVFVWFQVCLLQEQRANHHPYS